jgi:hypothetical protein
MITEAALLDPGHAPDDLHFGLVVAQAFQPIDIGIIVPVGTQVMLYSIIDYFRLLTNKNQWACVSGDWENDDWFSRFSIESKRTFRRSSG